VKRALDLGCDCGRHLVYLAKHNFDVYEIDIVEKRIQTARNWLRRKES